MYMPPAFREDDASIMHDLIRACPLACVVTRSPGGLEANHLPLVLDVDEQGAATLLGHVSRANSMWRERDPDADVLAIFQGPDAYITPSWYPAKTRTGKVVPTWNYVAVHATGNMRVIEDPVWLRRQLDALTARHEASFPTPWAVSDAPPDYIEAMLRNIVGIEITVKRLCGKWKASQNQTEENRNGALAGLRATGTPRGEAMADCIAARCPAEGRP